MSKYQSTTHVTYNIGYHVVFSPKYQYNLLRYRAADRLKEQLSEKTRQLHITILTMEVMPDHVHLFICSTPSFTLPNIVRELKGYTSYRLRAKFHYLRHYPTLWTRSYFEESVGHISEKTVVHYIENQKTRALSSPS